MSYEDTIVAIATPAGEGGIAVVRISGSQALSLADKVWKGKSLINAESHTAHLGMILNEDKSILDQAVATIFKAPNSFTGEDTVEFSIHGGNWLQKAVLHRLIDVGGRPAERGEFTRRAFLNGRLDLAQAEGIADLIAADSRAAHRLAMTQTSGRFSSKLAEIRQQLIDFAAMLELELDFSEEDVEFANREALKKLCGDAFKMVSSLAESFRSGRMFKEGVPVVIAGKPNAGKSTLLNAIAEDDLAIVSDIPGTTRDIIETTTEINGIRFRFSDTAGLHATEETIELQGIERAKRKISNSVIILWLEDLSSVEYKGIPKKEEILEKLGVTITEDAVLITVLTKKDIATKNDEEEINKGSIYEDDVIMISARAPEDINRIKDLISSKVKRGGDEDGIVVSNARHYSALKAAAEDLNRAQTQLELGTSADIIAMDVRQAIQNLSEITGQISSTDLLQTIFSRFCIGK